MEITLPSINIVIAKYNRSVDFAKKFTCLNLDVSINVFIYEKENPESKYNVPINKGNEASSYLKYIIDNYDTLPDYSFFIHDEEYSWHHTGSIVDRFMDALNSKKDFYNVNDGKVAMTRFLSECVTEFNILFEYLDWYDSYLFHTGKLRHINLTKKLPRSAQFLVHRKCIHRTPLMQYKRLYEWIISVDNPKISNWVTGWWMEYAWDILFDVYDI